MILLRKFNRRSTVIRPQHFGNPLLTSMSELELPRGSTYHFPPQAESVIGPQQNHPIIAKAEKLTQMRFHVKLGSENIIGRPIEKPVPLNSEVLRYLRMNKRIRRLGDTALIERDSRTLLIENYALLPMRYRYGKGVFAWYDQWNNEFATVMAGIAKSAKEFPERQNYIELHMPNSVPSIAQFRRAEIRRDINTTKPFTDPNNLFLLELWTWLGPNRQNGILASFDKDILSRINVIIIHGGKFFNLNLGELDFWRKDGKDGKIDPLQMQKRLFKSCYVLATSAAQATEEEDNIRKTDEANTDDLVDDGVVEASKEPISQPSIPDEMDDEMIQDVEDDIELFEHEMEEMELGEEDSIEIVKRDNFEKDSTPVIDKPITVAEGIEKECSIHIEAGVMTAKRYNYLTEISESYKSIENPFGEGTLEDMMEVTQEDVKVKEEVMFDDITIIDKSIAKSTLNTYDKQYIEKVMPKDMVNTVLSLQKAGIVVTGYTTEAIVDAANKVMLHKVKVVPVDGEPSVIQFTTPIMDERGYWTANDVTYTMRKQRVDFFKIILCYLLMWCNRNGRVKQTW